MGPGRGRAGGLRARLAAAVPPALLLLVILPFLSSNAAVSAQRSSCSPDSALGGTRAASLASGALRERRRVRWDVVPLVASGGQCEQLARSARPKGLTPNRSFLAQATEGRSLAVSAIALAPAPTTPLAAATPTTASLGDIKLYSCPAFGSIFLMPTYTPDTSMYKATLHHGASHLRVELTPTDTRYGYTFFNATAESKTVNTSLRFGMEKELQQKIIVAIPGDTTSKNYTVALPRSEDSGRLQNLQLKRPERWAPGGWGAAVQIEPCFHPHITRCEHSSLYRPSPALLMPLCTL